jgi:hypothetical protein
LNYGRIERLLRIFGQEPSAFCTLRGVPLRFFYSLFGCWLAASGCGNSASSRLEGRWEGASVENVDLEQLATATGWVRGLAFQFAGAAVTIGMATELPRSGSYRVAREQGKDLTLEIRGPSGQVDVAEFILDSDTQLRWRIGDGRSVVLRRAP